MSGPAPGEEVGCLVVAKAPYAGRSKTRLGADIGMAEAAEIAAAALLDTLEVCTRAFTAARCQLALEGDLSAAVAGADLLRGLRGWRVFPQRGEGFDVRLVRAHQDSGPGPVLQIGMDTPQITPPLLREVAASLARHDAVLGAAADGGWWVLALRRTGDASAMLGVPMSTGTTGPDTCAALTAAGLDVGAAPVLRDVDTVADADAVARQAPGTRFARAWTAARAAAGSAGVTR